MNADSPDRSRTTYTPAGRVRDPWPGLYEPRFPLVRRITRSGGQLALYLPREIERAFGLAKGTRVRIFARGDEIIIQPA